MSLLHYIEANFYESHELQEKHHHNYEISVTDIMNQNIYDQFVCTKTITDCNRLTSFLNP